MLVSDWMDRMDSTRVTRGALAAAMGAVLLASLVACTPAAPKLTAAQKCTPTNAKISWGTPVDGAKQPVEAHLLSFQGGVAISTPVQTSVSTSATLSFAHAGRTSDFSKISIDPWYRALVASVRATKAVPSGFGDGKPVEPSDIQPSRAAGKYFVVTEEKLTTVPFTIACAGEKPVTGSLAAYADTGSYGTITQCGTMPKGLSPVIIGLMGPACTRA
jgi:hypothetical protein